MHMLSPLRKALKIFHPEGIPWPGTVLYNAISKVGIFQETYDLIARDILTYSSRGALLDIGTGPGRLLMKLSSMSPGLTMTGLDVSPSMVKKAQKNMQEEGLSDSVPIRVGNASNLPFPDQSFDLIVSTGSIHHWKEPKRSFNEIHRVLTDGGYALMYDLVSDTPAPVLRQTAREFGKVKMVLMWVHAFEEPFYSSKGFNSLPHDTLFVDGNIRFVGIMCCLVLRKKYPVPE